MEKCRNSPQPTDTRLARFVARQLRRWPFAWASTVRARDAQIGNLRGEIYSLYREIDHIRRDYIKIMKSLTPPIFAHLIDVRGETDLVRNDLKIRVDFVPVYIRIAREEIAIRHRMSNSGQHMAEEAARALSHEHRKQVEKVILSNLSQVLKQKETA